MMTRSQIAQKLLDAAKNDGGITMSASDYAEPTFGYVVGGVSPTLTIPAYTAKYQPLMAIHSIIDWLVTRPGYEGEVVSEGFIGSWMDDKGNVYIDQCDILETENDAIALGELREEIAIYSLTDEREITI